MAEDVRLYGLPGKTIPGLMGVRWRQLIPVGLAIGWLMVSSMFNQPLTTMLAPWPPLLWFAFGRIRGAKVHEVAVPVTAGAVAALRGRGQWVPSDLLGDRRASRLPELAGLELVEVDGGRFGLGTSIGVVRDRKTGWATMVLRASGSQFAGATFGEQDDLVAKWGDAVGHFAAERGSVVRVGWSEWSARTGSDEHRDWLREMGVFDRTDRAAVDYRELGEAEGARAVCHETLLTVTVDQRRVPRRGEGSRLDQMVEALGQAVDLFCRRLATAGLDVSAPLSAHELTTAVRMRSDPTRVRQAATLARSLAAAAGEAPMEWGRLARKSEWTRVRLDDSVHRVYEVRKSPRRPVRADFLAPLLTAAPAPGCARTVSVVFELFGPESAAQRAEQTVMSVEGDQYDKQKRRMRVTRRERRRLKEAEAREAELDQGHAGVGFVALVDVAAPSDAELGEYAATVEQQAATAKLDLSPLTKRHERGWVACLPLGRTVRSTRRR